jgi:hypothetical protein
VDDGAGYRREVVRPSPKSSEALSNSGEIMTPSPRPSRRLLTLAAICATQPSPEELDPPGFLSGLLHGFLILFSFIASLFTDYRIYAFPNSGGWYDFGYLLGAMMFLGGGGAGARK